jgi:hypothetical protein
MASLLEMQKAKRAVAFGTLMNDYSESSSEKEGPENPQEELLCEMLEASAQAKVFHWQTSSAVEHKVLGKFYEEFNELMDKFIKTYQGSYGRMMVGSEMEVKPYTMDAPVTFLESFKAYVSGDARMFVMGNSALTSILDEISVLTSQTIYQLTFK